MAQFKLDRAFRQQEPAGLITPFLQIVGFNNLRNRAERLLSRMARDPFAKIVLEQRHSLELSLWELVRQYREYQRLPTFRRPTGIYLPMYRAYNFMDLLVDVYGRLSSAGQGRLQGMIRHAFNDENDLYSVAHELDVICYLTQFDCTITCSDLEGSGGRADFLVERDGIEFEVECKVVSVDKGRQIHQYDILALQERMTWLLDHHCEDGNGGVLLDLRIPARMPRDPAVLNKIAETIQRCVESRSDVKNELCEIAFHSFDMSDNPFNHEDPRADFSKRKFVERLTGTMGAPLIMKASPGRAALVISIGSRKPEKLSSATYSTLKEASVQLSGRRPAIIAALFPTYPDEDFSEMVMGVSGVQLKGLTDRLFRSDKRRHIHAVHLFTEVGYGLTRSGYFHVPNQAYWFYNPDSTCNGDLRLRLDPAPMP